MSSDDPPPSRKVLRKILSQGGSNAGKIWWPGRHRDDGNAETIVDLVQVDDVEAPDGDPIEQDRAKTRLVAGRLHQLDDLLRRVGPVDPNSATYHGLDVRGRREDDTDQRGGFLIPSERAVIDPDDPDVTFGERTP